jgi:hypothetical protein
MQRGHETYPIERKILKNTKSIIIVLIIGLMPDKTARVEPLEMRHLTKNLYFHFD